MRRITETTGIRQSSTSRRKARSVPSAGQTMKPAAPCSRITFMTCACRAGLSPVLARNGTIPAAASPRSIPTASSAKKGLVRSLMIIPTVSAAPLRRLAAPRL